MAGHVAYNLYEQNGTAFSNSFQVCESQLVIWYMKWKDESIHLKAKRQIPCALPEIEIVARSRCLILAERREVLIWSRNLASCQLPSQCVIHTQNLIVNSLKK